MSLKYNTFQLSKTIVDLPRKGGTIKIVPFGDIHRDGWHDIEILYPEHNDDLQDI